MWWRLGLAAVVNLLWCGGGGCCGVVGGGRCGVVGGGRCDEVGGGGCGGCAQV